MGFLVALGLGCVIAYVLRKKTKAFAESVVDWQSDRKDREIERMIAGWDAYLEQRKKEGR